MFDPAESHVRVILGGAEREQTSQPVVSRFSWGLRARAVNSSGAHVASSLGGRRHDRMDESRPLADGDRSSRAGSSSAPSKSLGPGLRAVEEVGPHGLRPMAVADGGGEGSRTDDGGCDDGGSPLVGVKVGSAAGIAVVRGQNQAGHAVGSDCPDQQLIAPCATAIGGEMHLALAHDLDAGAEFGLDHHFPAQQGAPRQEREQRRDRKIWRGSTSRQIDALAPLGVPSACRAGRQGARAEPLARDWWFLTCSGSAAAASRLR